MNDSIRRQDAIDEIARWYGYLDKDMILRIQTRLKKVPPAQPERKRGRWIMHIDDLFPEESTMECNQCHEHQPITIDDNFCPNCGAEMQKGEEDEVN